MKRKVYPASEFHAFTSTLATPRKFPGLRMKTVLKMVGAQVASGPDEAPELAVEPKKPGVMVALDLPAHTAKGLAIKDGEAPEKMHLTLAYLGRLGDGVDAQQLEELGDALSAFAKTYGKSIKSTIGGIGRFSASESSDHKDVIYASIDASELPEFRYELLKVIRACGLTVNAEHGFTPHITLGHIDPDADAPIKRLDPRATEFESLSLCVGAEKTNYRMAPKIVKNLYGTIIKAEKRLVCGVVLQPDVVDAQGDVVDADTIESAAHEFLTNINLATQLGLQHKHFAPNVKLVESYVAPVDFKLGEKDVSRGTWMITVKVLDDEIWEQVSSGKIRGFSIGGTAKTQSIH